MFPLLLTLFTLSAQAFDLPLGVTLGAKRSVKVDFIYAGIGAHALGSDWKPAYLEQWTAALDCEQVAERRERCRFRDGVVLWGFVPMGSQLFTFIQLPAPGEVEFTWSARGKLAGWEVLGDRDAFHEQGSNAMLALYHRQDVVFRPDAQRRIGAWMEGNLTRALAGVLEYELPKKAPSSGTWVTKNVPWAARRNSQGVASGRFDHTASESQGLTAISWKGSQSEGPPVGSATQTFVEADVIGKVRLDPTTGQPTHTRIEALYHSTSQLVYGHTRYLAISTPLTETGPLRPIDVPDFEIR